MKDNITNYNNTISYERIDRPGSYIVPRTLERNKIVHLLSLGHEPTYYRNFIMINGKTFNGWSKEDIEKLKQGEE